MKKAIWSIVWIIVLSTAANAAEHCYEIDLMYSYEDISSESVKVKPITYDVKVDNLPGEYVAEVIDFDGNVLNVTFFDIPLEILYDSFDEETGYAVGGGLIELNETDFQLNLPYYDNAKEIIIYDQEIKEKLRIDVSPYAKDVPADFDEEAPVETKEIPPEKEVEEELVEFNFIPVIIFVLIIAMIAVFVLRRKPKKKHKKHREN